VVPGLPALTASVDRGSRVRSAGIN